MRIIYSGNQPRLISILFLGYRHSGKSTLLLSLFGNDNTTNIPVPIKYFNNLTLNIANYSANIDERIQVKFNTYKIIFIVFDLTCKDSFYNLPHLVEEVQTNTHRHIQIVVIGTKKDLVSQRAVPLEKIERYIQSLGTVEYYEASIHDNRFDKLSQLVVEYFNNCFNILHQSQVDLVSFTERSYIDLEYYRQTTTTVSKKNNNNNNKERDIINMDNQKNIKVTTPTTTITSSSRKDQMVADTNTKLLKYIMNSKYLREYIFRLVGEIHNTLGLMSTKYQSYNIDFLLSNRYFNLLYFMIAQQEKDKQILKLKRVSVGLVKLLRSGYDDLELLDKLIPKQKDPLYPHLKGYNATRLCDDCCIGGNEKVVKFLYNEKGYKWSINGLRMVIMLGNLSVLQYIIENTPFAAENYISAATTFNKIEEQPEDSPIRPFYLTRFMIKQSIVLAKIYNQVEIKKYLKTVLDQQQQQDKEPFWKSFLKK